MNELRENGDQNPLLPTGGGYYRPTGDYGSGRQVIPSPAAFVPARPFQYDANLAAGGVKSCHMIGMLFIFCQEISIYLSIFIQLMAHANLKLDIIGYFLGCTWYSY